MYTISHLKILAKYFLKKKKENPKDGFAPFVYPDTGTGKVEKWIIEMREGGNRSHSDGG